MTDELKLKISLLPDSPGVYRYYNAEGTIIYVGKAKNLKRRVSSYFNKVHDVTRTNMLVRHIHDLQYTVVNTEEEALDLENSLIKEFQPRYNVLLKDDKSYPWICVTRELYPRVLLTRDRQRRGGRYFGPYPKAEAAHALLHTIARLYPLRNCNHNVSRETIDSAKHRLCLQYHIKRCAGCCRGLVDADTYQGYIDSVVAILRGDSKLVSNYLQAEMQRLAEELRFEEANELKNKYLLIEKLRSKSVIVSPTVHNIDVFALHHSDDCAYVHYMHIRNGSVVQSMTLEYRLRQLDEAVGDGELMSLAVQEIRQRFAETYKADRVREVVVNIQPDVAFADLQFVVPQRGDKRKLLDIALKNARQFETDKLNRMEKLNPEQRATRTLTVMQRDLHLAQLPRHIECFDNSNIAGTSPVASCVVFRNAKPSKKEYRHFNIKTAAGADDYASMAEVITRRYTRLEQEGEPLPQLVVVDGGKGQLSTAVEALSAMGLQNRIAAIGLAKQLNEIYFPGDTVPLYIDKNSETLRVIQHLRDEAHRFAIGHHRKQRGRGQVHSALDDIKGIGPATQKLLLKEFKSVKRIREAGEDTLAAVIGPAKARLIAEALSAGSNHAEQR
ncbi:MAG: excinuclease ABC subunit C [Muribaculaceae bacterium]|nr:excinuclease ABC subunit C [Muribaculaceae bacterium]